MVAKVEICRQALAHIGSDTFIESIEENSKEAKTCKMFFQTSLDILLRTYNWNFATKKQALTPYGTAPDDFAYQYKYPDDCLKARRIMPVGLDTITFNVVNVDGVKVIQTDLEEAVLEYTKKITDLTLLDPLFAEALGYKLATVINTPLSSDKSRMEINNTLLQNSIYNAQQADGNEGQAEEPQEASWIKARF